MLEFYRLAAVQTYGPEAIYGRLAWGPRYGTVEWGAGMRRTRITCPIDAEHQRSGPRQMGLTVVLPSPSVGDFAWTWHSECLFTDHVLDLFTKARLTGYDARPVTVGRVKRGRGLPVPRLWELNVTGRAGPAHRKSGIRVIERCAACNLVRYSSFRHGIIVDEARWDGSDFCTVDEYPRHYLITPRVKDLIIANELKPCVITPSRDIKWPSVVIRPEDV